MATHPWRGAGDGRGALPWTAPHKSAEAASEWAPPQRRVYPILWRLRCAGCREAAVGRVEATVIGDLEDVVGQQVGLLAARSRDTAAKRTETGPSLPFSNGGLNW